MLEAGISAVIGVRHFGFLEPTGVAEHGFDPGRCLGPGFASQPLHGGQVAVIHGEHQVETREILQADLSCAAGEVDAAAVGSRLHASVRRIAHMPAARAGGIHHELITEATLVQQMQEDAFRRW